MNSKFIDLEEIENPINIDIYTNKNISKIDSIELIDDNSFLNKFSKAYKKKDNKGKVLNREIEKDLNNKSDEQEKDIRSDKKVKKQSLKRKCEKLKEGKSENDLKKQFNIVTEKSREIDNSDIKEKVETQDIREDYLEGDDIDDIEELESLEDSIEEPVEELDSDINVLAERAFDGKNDIIPPGEISLTSIDKVLSNPELNIQETSTNESSTEEIFGVNRARIFYNIDKEIYSTRSTSIFSKSKLKSIKKGILFPASVASAIFFISFVVIVFLLIFFRSVSASSLEDNIIKDESILAKIAKQMDEERRLAALKLEEERRKLEEERRNLESTINEELLKKEADIENRFLQRLKDLEKSGITKEEKEKLETEKEEALIKAREERDSKIQEQNKLLAEKDEKIKLVVENLKKESQSYEQEILRIKQEFEEKRKEEEKRIEIANQRLNEIKEAEEKIAQFNFFVYQLITKAMSEYKKGNLDLTVLSLNSVLKYYNSNLDFVLLHDELKNKMDTDVFFVESIGSLVEKSKGSILFNRDYVRIINKFKKVVGYYDKAENFNNNGEYEKSSKEYSKVLKEFEEINDAYTKLMDNEKKTQDSLASNYLADVNKQKEAGNYKEALENLYLILEKAPLSDYRNTALEELVKTNEILSLDLKVNQDNEKAKIIFDRAESYKKSKDYDNAKKLYEQIILNYPLSDYTKKALEESNNIKNVVDQKVSNSNEADLKGKFSENYKKYQYYNSRSDFERARIYYFEALRNSFDIYTENSIIDFKKEEDRYIEELIIDNLNSKDAENAEVIKSIQKEPGDYERELKSKFVENYKKYQYYNSRSDFERARIYYFEALKNSFDPYANNSILSFKKEEDRYIEGLVKENLKNKDIYIESLIAEYDEKIKKIEQEYKELKDKYEELEKKYNEKKISMEEKEKIRNEIEISLEDKHILLKRNEIDNERKKDKDEFISRLYLMKRNIESINKDKIKLN